VGKLYFEQDISDLGHFSEICQACDVGQCYHNTKNLSNLVQFGTMNLKSSSKCKQKSSQSVAGSHISGLK
jgi:hypothetical protein